MLLISWLHALVHQAQYGNLFTSFRERRMRPEGAVGCRGSFRASVRSRSPALEPNVQPRQALPGPGCCCPRNRPGGCPTDLRTIALNALGL